MTAIVDNTKRRVGDFLRERIEAGSDLSIVSAYFTIYAYDALRDALESAGRTRFLHVRDAADRQALLHCAMERIRHVLLRQGERELTHSSKRSAASRARRSPRSRDFAMKDVSAYRKPMKEFLSKFMRQNKDAADTALDSPWWNPASHRERRGARLTRREKGAYWAYATDEQRSQAGCIAARMQRGLSPRVVENSRDVFERTCESVIKTLGDRPFHIRSGLNPAALDAVMVAFAEHLDEIPNDISERYRNLIESGEFDQDTRRRTTDVERVRARFRQASQRLFGA